MITRSAGIGGTRQARTPRRASSSTICGRLRGCKLSSSDHWIQLSAAVKDFADEAGADRPKSGSHQSFDELSPSGAVLSWLCDGRLPWRSGNGVKVFYDPWNSPGAQRSVISGSISANTVNQRDGTVQHHAVMVEVSEADFADLADEYLSKMLSRASAENEDRAETKPKQAPLLSGFGDMRFEPDPEKRRAREAEMAAFERAISEGRLDRPEPPISVLATARERRDAVRQAQRPAPAQAALIPQESVAVAADDKPSETPTASTKSGVRTTSEERAAAKAGELIAALKERPENRESAYNQIRAAVAPIGNLTARGFQFAWAQNARPEWRKGGRRKKSPHPGN